MRINLRAISGTTFPPSRIWQPLPSLQGPSQGCRYCQSKAKKVSARCIATARTTAETSNSTRVPGSVQLPPAPALWEMGLRLSTILRELAAMRWRLFRGVPIDVRARKMRETFVRLGPAFIKAGQALATRPDMGIPPQVCKELAKLQYEMDPFPSNEARRVISEELGRPVDELFSELSEHPVAAASLGQVYRGRLAHPLDSHEQEELKETKKKLHGIEVAVKVQRPGLEPRVVLDAYVLRILAKIVQLIFNTNSDLAGMTGQLAGRIFEEIDYRNEAAYATQFGELYRSPNIVVPRIIDTHSTAKILTMEWIDGVPLAGLPRLQKEVQEDRKRPIERDSSNEDVIAANAKTRTTMADHAREGAEENMEQKQEGDPTHISGEWLLDSDPIIERGVRCSLEQLLENGYFHADPHPGNLMVTPQGQLVYLDFGMMGVLDVQDRLDMIRIILHFVNRDAAGLAKDFVSLGFLSPDTPLPAVEAALQEAFKSREVGKRRKPAEKSAEAEERHGGDSDAPENDDENSDDDTRLNFQGVLRELSSVMLAEYRFRVPPRFALVIRALGALEGTVIKVDPDFKVLARAYPHVLEHLVRDRSPQMRAILRGFLVDEENNSIRWQRLERLVSPFSGTIISPQAYSSRTRKLLQSSPAISLLFSEEMAAAASDGLDFLLSPRASRLRESLVGDIIDGTEHLIEVQLGMRAESSKSSRSRDSMSDKSHEEADLFSSYRFTPRSSSSSTASTSAAYTAANGFADIVHQTAPLVSAALTQVLNEHSRSTTPPSAQTDDENHQKTKGSSSAVAWMTLASRVGRYPETQSMLKTIVFGIAQRMAVGVSQGLIDAASGNHVAAEGIKRRGKGGEDEAAVDPPGTPGSFSEGPFQR